MRIHCPWCNQGVVMRFLIGGVTHRWVCSEEEETWELDVSKVLNQRLSVLIEELGIAPMRDLLTPSYETLGPDDSQ